MIGKSLSKHKMICGINLSGGDIMVRRYYGVWMKSYNSGFVVGKNEKTSPKRPSNYISDSLSHILEQRWYLSEEKRDDKYREWGGE